MNIDIAKKIGTGLSQIKNLVDHFEANIDLMPKDALLRVHNKIHKEMERRELDKTAVEKVA